MARATLVAPMSEESLWIIHLVSPTALQLSTEDADEIMAMLISKPETESDLGIALFDSGDETLQGIATRLPEHIQYTSYQARHGDWTHIYDGTVYFLVP